MLVFYNYGIKGLKLNLKRRNLCLKDFLFVKYLYKEAMFNLKNLNNFIKHGLRINRRKQLIPLSQLGREVSIYNGYDYKIVRITSKKVGRRYCDFSFTKKMGSIIHVMKTKKNKKVKKKK